MEPQGRPPIAPYAVVFGPHANCTLETCDLQYSVYKYLPSLAANVTFIALYSLALIVHVYLGWKWRSMWFAVLMVLGCVFEIIGYTGRIILHSNPFSFPGFMIQIILVTGAPVFYTAAIYMTLAQTIDTMDRSLSRFKSKKAFALIFIPADAFCLVLQAVGGALTTAMRGNSQTGVDMALAGLGLQVVVLFAFVVVFIDYLVRYRKKHPAPAGPIRVFLAALFTGIVLILARCSYRVHELSQGYQNSTVITNEALFIVLEGVLIVAAVFCLTIGHPGFLFGKLRTEAENG